MEHGVPCIAACNYVRPRKTAVSTHGKRGYESAVVQTGAAWRGGSQAPFAGDVSAIRKITYSISTPPKLVLFPGKLYFSPGFSCL